MADIIGGTTMDQISFYYLKSPSESGYGSDTYKSKYQGQQGPTPSKSHTDFIK